jgi:uncharacterized cupin superfamily protein
MDTQTAKKIHLVRAVDLVPAVEEAFSHPLNPASEVRGHSLGDPCGLSRIGVHLLRVPPGKESFVYHAHHGEEEFIYILSGRGVAEIADEQHEVGPGDFLGFPAPSVGHNLRNPFAEDLVYLSGGERHAMEIADYPRLNKRLVRVGAAASLYDGTGQEAFPGMPVVPRLET